MKHSFQTLLSAVVVALLTLTPAGAQSDSRPLIVVIDNDLYRLFVDGPIQQLTQRPENRRVAYPFVAGDVFPSPDGRFAIYRDAPDFAADAWNNNETGNIGELPTDLYLLDLDSGEQTLIAGHDAATTWGSGVKYYRAVSGRAAWSPDSRQFAYLEFDGVVNSILVYDLDVDTTHELDVHEPATAEWRQMQWTANGLFAGTRHFAADGTSAITYLHDGLLGEYAVTFDGRDYLSVSQLGNPTPDGMVYLFDVVTGAYFRANGYVSIVSALLPEISLVLLDYTNNTRPRGVYTPDGDLLFAASRNPPFPVDFMLAPDGAQYAYVEVGEGARGSVIAGVEGEQLVLDAIDVVGWGAGVYTLFDPLQTVTLELWDVFETEAACGVLASAGLIPGGQGEVLGSTPNRVRAAPRLDAEQTGTIPAGERFEVAVGQQGVCSGGIRWAQVTYDGLTGWTAEGVDGELFVRPV